MFVSCLDHKQAYLGSTLLSPHGEGVRKGTPNIVSSTCTLLANRSQLSIQFAVETVRKNIEETDASRSMECTNTA